MRSNEQMMPEGFHGDKHLQNKVDEIMQECDTFIETGTNVGSTLNWFANKYKVPCYSCEISKDAYQLAIENTNGLDVYIENSGSIEFLNNLDNNLFNKKPLFWLDAHGWGFEWPLRYEIDFITNNFKNAFILIDDFKVPGKPMFKYDKYNRQICSYDYIKDSIHPLYRNITYPDYTEKTSKFHPLKGWGLLKRKK